MIFRTGPLPMHQIVSASIDTSRRWWVLAVVVAAQFMFGVDAFIVNVAIPTTAKELPACAAQVEAVIAIYLIGYTSLVVTGRRSGPELIVARLARRRCGDQRGIFRGRGESFGAVCAVDWRLRRIPDMDASRHGDDKLTSTAKI
jgi:hypothetical protein